MSERAITQTYEPNPVLSYVYQRFFDHIAVDETWVRTVREAAARGPVVYVLRNLSFLDFLVLDHLTKRHGLPQIRFANDLGLWVLEPMGKGWLQAFRGRHASASEELAHAIRAGSAALFLKRAPTMIERGLGRSGVKQTVSEGDEIVRALVALQRASDRPIQLVPQVFVWTKRPDTRGGSVVDYVLGPREWPGKVRTTLQFLANYKHVIMRAGEPLDLGEFLRTHGGERDEVLVRRVTYSLLRKLERERRTILGPVKKPNDRVREEVLRSPKLQQMIKDLAGEGEKERLVLTVRAYSMLRELEAQPEPDVIKAFDLALDQIVHKIYEGTEVDQDGLARVREAAKRGTVVLLPSHKSHFDYLLLSHIFYKANLQVPVIAAGDNLSFFPMGPIFRRGGAFFIRRSFKGDRLYGAVVDAYIRRLLRDGWTVEFFLEGGRSRTGKLLPPKVGLLGMVVDAALSIPNREVFFVPVSIGYERLVEGGSYVRELAGGEKKKEDAGALLRSTRLLSGRYGRLNIQFGDTLTLAQAAAKIGVAPDPERLTPAQRRSLVQRLAHTVMGEINRVTAVTPGAIVALALLASTKRGLSHGELVEAAERLVGVLRGMGARISELLVGPDGHVREQALRDAAQLFVDADMLHATVPGEVADHGDRAYKRRARIYTGPDVVYVVPEEKRLSLDISKNIVIHFFVPRALVSTAMLVPVGRRADDAAGDRTHLARSVLEGRVRQLSRLFKFEFQFRADQSFEDNFAETLAAMFASGELAAGPGDTIGFGPGHDGYDGRAWTRFYAQSIRGFLEGYRIAARALSLLLKGPMTQKDLAKRALTLGERMYLEGDVQRREAINRPVIENALLALADQGYVTTKDGKLTLPDSLATPGAVAAIEARIAGYWTSEGEAP